MRVRRRDGCRHVWRASPAPGLLVVQDCPACRASVLDVLQVLMVQLYRTRALRLKWVRKFVWQRKQVAAARAALATVEHALAVREGLADRMQVLIAENYALKARLAAVERRTGAA